MSNIIQSLQNLKPKAKKERKGGKSSPNSFLLFSNEQRKFVFEEYPGKSNAEVSRILGERWKDLHPNEKKRYRQMADEIKAKKSTEQEEDNVQIVETKIRKTPDSEDAIPTTKKCKLEDPAYELPTNDIFEIHEQVLSVMPSKIWEDEETLNPAFIDTNELLSMIDNLTSPPSPPLWYEFSFNSEPYDFTSSLPIL